MKIGKLNWDDLNCIIEQSRGKLRDEVRIRSGVGEDCCVIGFGEYECVLSTDPITGAEENIGKLAVHINTNDIASCGVEPLGIMVTLLAPPHSSLDDIKKVMKEIGEEASAMNMEILGGHTEVTDAVNRMIVSCTVIGRGKKGKAVATSGAQLDDDIIVTKNLCLEGTSIIATDYESEMKNLLSQDEIEEAKSYMNDVSVVREGIICGEFAVHSMHDITEGGVLGALWEVADASGCGFKVYKESMPCTDITSKICSAYGIDPLRLISSGSMLITTDRGEELVHKLKAQGMNATIVGKITEKNGILVDENEEIHVTPPERDELFRLKEIL